MSDPRQNENRLIADIFHDDWEMGLPARYARAAAVSARKRRCIRHSLMATAATVAMMTAAMIGVHLRPRPSPPAAFAKHQPQAARGYEIISDAELLAALQDRSVVMLRQRDGTNEFVLVGQ